MASEIESDLRDTVDWGRKWLVDFNGGKTQLVSFNWSNNAGAVDVKMNGSVLEEKSSFKILGIILLKFISPEAALYLYKSTLRPCMEYCCHVWARSPNCYLELLDKLKNGYAEVSVLQLLLLLNHWLIVEM